MNQRVICATLVLAGAQRMKGVLSHTLGNTAEYIPPVHSQCSIHMEGSEDPTIKLDCKRV